jgi:hypothetical protein
MVNRFYPCLTTRLQFGCAAVVGIVAGVGLGAISNVVIAALDLNLPDGQIVVYKKKKEPSMHEMKRLDDYSSQDSDWQWLDQSLESDSRRRKRKGLLASTILEEESDS